jgi:hypothetical protein
VALGELWLLQLAPGSLDLVARFFLVPAKPVVPLVELCNYRAAVAVPLEMCICQLSTQVLMVFQDSPSLHLVNLLLGPVAQLLFKLVLQPGAQAPLNLLLELVIVGLVEHF